MEAHYKRAIQAPPESAEFLWRSLLLILSIATLPYVCLHPAAILVDDILTSAICAVSVMTLHRTMTYIEP